MEFPPWLRRDPTQFVVYYVWTGAPDSSWDDRSGPFVYLLDHLRLLLGHFTEEDIAIF